MPSKSAKTRKHDRKRAHKELSARRTDESRKRRLENKAKREAIHDIDPDVKIKIIDQDTYIDGDRVEVVDGKIVPSVLPEVVKSADIKIQTNEQKMAEIGMIPSSLPEGAIKTECDFEDAVAEYQEATDKETMDKYAIGEITAVQPEEPDCKLPAEKKSWKQVLKEWSNG